VTALRGFLLGTLVLVSSAGAGAQVKASEPASVSQTVDGTVITVEYSRPEARGRDSVFGGEVKWNEVWTPGANYATTLEVSKDITLDGHPVMKGKYSVWMQIRQEGPWTMVLDPRSHLFHMAHVDSTADQLRYQVDPIADLPTEVLTWEFPEVRIGGTTLTMRWGRVRVPLHIEVQPSYTLKVTPQDARPYIGSYDFHWMDSLGVDSTTYGFALTSRNSTLHGEWTAAPDPTFGPFALIPIREKWFNIALLENGKVYQIYDDLTFEWTVRDGRAVSFELRDDKDELVGQGQRR